MMRWRKWRQKWLDLPISRKLSFAIGGILGFLIFTTAVSTILFFSMARQNEQMLERQETWFSQQEIKHYIYARINSVMEYISTGDEHFLHKFNMDCDAAHAYEKYLLDHTTVDQKEEIERFIQLSQDWEFVLRNQVIPVYQLGNVEDAWLTLIHTAEPMGNALIEEVSRFATTKEAEILELSRATSQLGERLMYFGIAITILAILMAIVLFVVLTNSINRPIRILHKGTQRIAKGDFYYRVSIASQDEFGQLGAAFNFMGERVNSLVVEMHEINQQLKVESKNAMAASRLKTDFLATVSHELRTPLNGIIGFSEALKEQMLGPLSNKQLEYIVHIDDNAKHLLDLINEILDLSKIEAGKMELALQPIDVQTFFDRSVGVIQELSRAKGIELVVENYSAVATIMGDAKRLTEIMNNLLSNAVKFTPPGGSIRVAIHDGDHALLVTVKDTGIGISAEGIEHVFTSFYQDTNAWNRQHEGTGLGLALTRKLIELHGGTITVDSVLGEGTTFTFSLPIMPRMEDTSPTVAATPSAPIYTVDNKMPHVWIIGNSELLNSALESISDTIPLHWLALTLSQFANQWAEVERLPNLIIFVWEEHESVEGHSLLPFVHKGAKQIQTAGVPIVLVTKRTFTLREKGLLYQFVKEIIDIDGADLGARIRSWVMQNGGDDNDSSVADSRR